MARSDRKTDLSGNLGFLTTMIKQFRLVWLLLWDNRISGWIKLIIPLSLVYLIFPLDIIPDVIPGLTQLDDLGVILLGMTLFVKLCPPELVAHYRNRIEAGADNDENTIDTTYRVIEE